MATVESTNNTAKATVPVTPVVLETLPPPPPQFILKRRYEILRKLGNGSFGVVYLAVDLQTKEEVAVKVEYYQTGLPQLRFESNVYRVIFGYGIPRFRAYGQDGDHRLLVIDLMGESLESLFNKCNRTFSMKTVLTIADQMILRLQTVHDRKFIHRDVKPENFVMGSGTRENVVHIIDFGLAKRYRLPGTDDHVPFRQGIPVTGTTRYMSLNAHNGLEHTRRDDLESLGYTLVYFLKGSLPWQGVVASNKKERCEKIGDIKKATTLDKLCSGLPAEFKEYFVTVRNLKYNEKPDYYKIRLTFLRLLRKLGLRYDTNFDWKNLPVRQTQSASSSSTPTVQVATEAQPTVPQAPASVSSVWDD